MSELTLIYVQVEGSEQGVFKTDDSRRGQEWTPCLAFLDQMEVPLATRTTSGQGDVQNKPIWLLFEWCPLIIQFREAAWGNEPLKKVKIKFVDASPEVPYSTMELTDVVVAGFHSVNGNIAAAMALAGIHSQNGDVGTGSSSPRRGLAWIGVSAEKCVWALKEHEGDVTAHYDRKDRK